VRGALAMARLARSLRKRGILLPGISAEEAALVDGIDVYRIDSLDRAVRFLTGEIQLTPLDAAVIQRSAPRPPSSEENGGHARIFPKSRDSMPCGAPSKWPWREITI
jgi:predicted ATPase with chaperone activity